MDATSVSSQANSLTSWLCPFQIGGLLAIFLGMAICSLDPNSHNPTSHGTIGITVLLAGLTTIATAAFIQIASGSVSGINRRKLQFSLAGMLGYTTVLAVLLYVPLSLLRFTDAWQIVVPVDLACLIGLTAWIGFGLWCVVGRRKVILMVVIGLLGLIIVTFLPLVCILTELVFFNTHHVDNFLWEVDPQGTLLGFYASLLNVLGTKLSW